LPAFKAETSDDEEQDVLIDLDMLSPGDDLGQRDLHMIQQSLADQDALVSSTSVRGSAALVEIYSPLDFLLRSSPGIEYHADPATAMHIEVPLTSDLNAFAEQKTQSPSNIFANVSGLSQTNHQKDQSDSDELIQLLQPLTKKLLQKIEHEHLTEADSASRVVVPVLDFIQPQYPWALDTSKKPSNKAEVIAQIRLVMDFKSEYPRELENWSGASKIERQLVWTPFPSELARVAIREKIYDAELEHAVLELVNLSDDILETADLISKVGGLRIAERPEDDEQMDFGIFADEEKDIDYLVNEKLQTLTGRSHKMVQTSHESGLSSKYQVRFLTPPHIPQKRPFQSILNENEASNYDSFFNADALNRFLALNKVSPSKRQKTASKTSRINAHRHSKQHQSEQPVVPNSPLIPFVPLPFRLPSRCVFVSALVFQQRRPFLRRLQQAYPTASFIERDFSTISHHITDVEELPSVEQQKEHTPIPHFDPTVEADLLLSPATGLLLTTLQRIHQVNLPGHAPAPSPFRQRLAQVAVRHERVIVLVSQAFEAQASDPLHSTRHLVIPDAQLPRYVPLPSPTPIQIKAFTSLCAYASTLKADVLVHLVPAGEVELCSWVVRQLVRFGTETVLRSEETLWEQVLRRMGLNAFAACWILTNLKRPELASSSPDPTATVESDPLGLGVSVQTVFNAAKSSSDNASKEAHGLAAFVLMTPEERQQRFAKAMGGNRVLGRVSDCLAKNWARTQLETDKVAESKNEAKKVVVMDKKSKFF
jgi:hypothetical protein